MAWYQDVALLLGGAFLANAIPHLVRGLTGEKFPTPFAKPPGVGESPPWVNALWGLVNLGAGYALVFGAGALSMGFTRSALMVAIGFAVTSLALARYFGRVRSH
ncbi:MAG: hypothetical protein ACK4K2_02320 [Dehalococcoidia bacterium]